MRAVRLAEGGAQGAKTFKGFQHPKLRQTEIPRNLHSHTAGYEGKIWPNLRDFSLPCPYDFAYRRVYKFSGGAVRAVRLAGGGAQGPPLLALLCSNPCFFPLVYYLDSRFCYHAPGKAFP